MRQAESLKWLWSFQTIREKIFEKAAVEMLHINDHEAQRYLKRFKKQQKKIKDRAQREEEASKIKEETVM